MAENNNAVHPIQRYLDISGTNQYGRAKATIFLNHSRRFSDGSSVTLQEFSVTQKPIVEVFGHPGYVNVRLNFLSRNDRDLHLLWEILEQYGRPSNGVAWLDEELETGYYTDENGNEQMVYFPMLELFLTPTGNETEYQMLGINPAFFTLQPPDPSGEPCVVQFTFQEGWFQVIERNNDNPIDLDAIKDEVMVELAMEQMAANEIEREEAENE